MVGSTWARSRSPRSLYLAGSARRDAIPSDTDAHRYSVALARSERQLAATELSDDEKELITDISAHLGEGIWSLIHECVDELEAIATGAPSAA